MQWKNRILMDLAFDCNPEEDSEDEELDLARSVFTKIASFLAGDGEDPPVGKASKRLNTDTNVLSMTIRIPHPATEDPVSPTFAVAEALHTKLKNNLDNFPPLVDGALPKFKFLLEMHPDDPEEEETEPE